MRRWTIRDQRSSTGGASQGLIKPFFPGGLREGWVRWTVVIKFHIGELGQTMRGSGYCSAFMATTPSDSSQGKQALNNLTLVTYENKQTNKQTWILKPFKDLNDIGQEQTVNTRTLQHRAETSEWGPYGRASHSSNRSYWPKRMNLVLPNYGNPMSILDPKASEYMDDQIVSLAKHLQYYVWT